MVSLRGQLGTPVELLGWLSRRVFRRGSLPARTGVMEVILKEVRFELAFWEEYMPSLVPCLCTEKGSVVGRVLVMSFSVDFVLILFQSIGWTVHIDLLNRHNFSPPDCFAHICPFPPHSYFADAWGDHQLQRWALQQSLEM